MNGALQEVVGPVAEEVADVDEDRRRWVGFGGGRKDGNGCPGWGGRRGGGRDDLEPGLPGPLEEEGNGAVVGVSACADVDRGTVGCACGDGRVVEETEGAAAGAGAAVAACEPIRTAFRRLDLRCVSAI